MKLINRIEYDSLLNSVKGTPNIKVITGIRRSGKSKLLSQYEKKFKENKKVNIIHIDFNMKKYESLKNQDALYNYIKKKYVKNRKNVLFIDEIELCEDFENAIISLYTEEKFDIYITGSNAFLLSSDLATLFTGRTFNMSIFPFSFKEYIAYYKYKDIYKAFENYVKFGGMSGAYLFKEDKLKYNYIKGVYETLILRDIKQKFSIKNGDVLDRISKFLISNISNIVSSRSITNTLVSSAIKVDHKTITKYINYMVNAFLFYKVNRYDIKGKKYLTSNEKYYLADHAFKYAVLGTKSMDYGYVYENIVAIELLRRGYELYVGVLYRKEIDFVAIKQSEQIYIQVSDDISNEKTLKREVEPLLSIKDGYKKIIIANTKHEMYQYEGIEIYDIADWLNKK